MSAIWRRLTRNFSLLLGSQGLTMLFGFTALAVNTRALPVTELGIFLMVQALCELVAKLVSVPTWQLMIKYGAEALETGNRSLFEAVWKLGLVIDLLAALVASGVALLLLLIAPKLAGLGPETSSLGYFYALMILVSSTSMGTGVLRLLDRMGLLAVIDVLAAACVCLAAIILWQSGADLWVYLIVVPFIGALRSAAATIVGWYYQKQTVAQMSGEHGLAQLNTKEALGFALSGSLVSSINGFRQQGELLIVGAILGPATAALFAVAYRIAAIPARVAEAARQAVYPEIAKLVAHSDIEAASKLAFRLSGLGCILVLPILIVLFFVGDEFLILGFGTKYADAQVMMLYLVAAAGIYLATFALGPLVQLTMGGPRFLLISGAAFVGFLLFAPIGPLIAGRDGAGWGAVVFSVLLALFLYLQIIRRKVGS
jgi:O-antigen/teichoic acid export membrane protein